MLPESREMRKLYFINLTTPVKLTQFGNKPENHTAVYD
jgi:hypothetical protein